MAHQIINILIFQQAIFLCKLGLVIWLILYGIREKNLFDQQEESDSSYLGVLCMGSLTPCTLNINIKIIFSTYPLIHWNWHFVNFHCPQMDYESE